MRQKRHSYRPVEEYFKRNEEVTLYKRCKCGGRARLITARGDFLPYGGTLAEYKYKCEVCKHEIYSTQ